MFRDKMRVTEPMNQETNGLSDSDLRVLSDMISKLPPPEPISDTADPAPMDRGRTLGKGTAVTSAINRISKASTMSRVSQANARITCSRRYALTRTTHAGATTHRCQRSCMQ